MTSKQMNKTALFLFSRGIVLLAGVLRNTRTRGSSGVTLFRLAQGRSTQK